MTDKPSRHILLVEDDPDQSVVLSLLLRRAGYTVSTTHSGAEALRILGSQEFAAVVCDWRLPELSGLSVLQQFRERESQKGLQARLPFLMLSAGSSEEKISEAMAHGANGYCDKNVSGELILEKLAKIIEES